MNDTDQESVHDMGTERYALELRAEAINLIAGEKAEREGKSDRLEIGAESATDKVAGGEDLSVGRALIEKANTASTTGLVLNTTVHGHLNANYFTDNIMLTGAMSETYAGALVTVAGMSDVMAAGGGMRVVAGADIRLSGLTGMEEKLFTLMNDGIMIDVFANAFEREFGTAIHNAVTGIISSKVEVLTATTWRPMMKTLVGLRSKNKGSAAGGDESIKSPPEAPPPPAGGEEVAAAGKLLSTGGKSVKRTASPNISLLSNLDSTVKLDEVVTSTDEIAVGLSKPTDDLASFTRGMGYTPATPAIDDLFGKPNTLKRTTSTPNISLLNLLDSTEKLDEVVTNADNGIAFGRSPDIASNLEDLRVADNAADLSDARPRRSDSFLHPDITTLSRYDIPNNPLPGDVDVDGLLTYLRKNANEMGEQISLVKEKIARQEKIEGFTGTGKKRIPKKKTSKKMQLKYETARKEKLEYIEMLNISQRYIPVSDEAKTLATEYRPHTYNLDVVFQSNTPISDDYLLWAKEKIKSEKLLLEEFDQSKKLTGYTREHSALYRKYEANNFAIDVIKENKDPIARIQRYKLLHYEIIPIEQLGSIDEVIDTVEDGLVNYVKHSDFQGSNPVRVTDIDGIGNESYLHQSSSVHGDEIPDEIVRSAEADATIRTTENINKEIEADKNKLLKMLEGYRDELHTQFNKKYKSQTGKIEKGSALELEQIRRKRRLALANIIKSIRKGVDPQVALDSDAFKKLDESQAIENFVNNTAELSRRSLEEPVETPPSPLIGRKELHYLSPEDLDLRPSSDYPVPNKRRNTIIMETRDFSPQSRFNVAPAAKTDAALAVVEPLGKSSRKGEISQIEKGIQNRLQITPDQVQIDETGKIPTKAPAAEEINVRKLSQSDAAAPILENGQAQWVKSLPDNISELEVEAFPMVGDEALLRTWLEGLDGLEGLEDSRRAEISSDPTNVRVAEPDSTAARAEESSAAENPVIRNDQQQWTEESKRAQQPDGNSGETRRWNPFRKRKSSKKGASKAIDDTTEALESEQIRTAINRLRDQLNNELKEMKNQHGKKSYLYQDLIDPKKFQEDALKLIDPKASNPFNKVEEAINYFEESKNIESIGKQSWGYENLTIIQNYKSVLNKIKDSVSATKIKNTKGADLADDVSILNNLGPQQIRKLTEDLRKQLDIDLEKIKTTQGKNDYYYETLTNAVNQKQAMMLILPDSSDPFMAFQRAMTNPALNNETRKTYKYVLDQIEGRAKLLAETNPQAIENSNVRILPETNPQAIENSNVRILPETNPQAIENSNVRILPETNPQAVENSNVRVLPEAELAAADTNPAFAKLDQQQMNSIINDISDQYDEVLAKIRKKYTYKSTEYFGEMRINTRVNSGLGSIDTGARNPIAELQRGVTNLSLDKEVRDAYQLVLTMLENRAQLNITREGNVFDLMNPKLNLQNPESIDRMLTSLIDSFYGLLKDTGDKFGKESSEFAHQHRVTSRLKRALDLVDPDVAEPFENLQKAISDPTLDAKTRDANRYALHKMGKLAELTSGSSRKSIGNINKVELNKRLDGLENAVKSISFDVYKENLSKAIDEARGAITRNENPTIQIRESIKDLEAESLIGNQTVLGRKRIKTYNQVLSALKKWLKDPDLTEPAKAITPPPRQLEADNVNNYRYLDNVSSSLEGSQSDLLTSRVSEASPGQSIGEADDLSMAANRGGATAGELSPAPLDNPAPASPNEGYRKYAGSVVTSNTASSPPRQADAGSAPVPVDLSTFRKSSVDELPGALEPAELLAPISQSQRVPPAASAQLSQPDQLSKIVDTFEANNSNQLVHINLGDVDDTFIQASLKKQPKGGILQTKPRELGRKIRWTEQLEIRVYPRGSPSSTDQLGSSMAVVNPFGKGEDVLDKNTFLNSNPANADNPRFGDNAASVPDSTRQLDENLSPLPLDAGQKDQPPLPPRTSEPPPNDLASRSLSPEIIEPETIPPPLPPRTSEPPPNALASRSVPPPPETIKPNSAGLEGIEPETIPPPVPPRTSEPPPNDLVSRPLPPLPEIVKPNTVDDLEEIKPYAVSPGKIVEPSEIKTADQLEDYVNAKYGPQLGTIAKLSEGTTVPGSMDLYSLYEYKGVVYLDSYTSPATVGKMTEITGKRKLAGAGRVAQLEMTGFGVTPGVSDGYGVTTSKTLTDAFKKLSEKNSMGKTGFVYVIDTNQLPNKYKAFDIDRNLVGTQFEEYVNFEGKVNIAAVPTNAIIGWMKVSKPKVVNRVLNDGASHTGDMTSALDPIRKYLEFNVFDKT